MATDLFSSARTPKISPQLTEKKKETRVSFDSFQKSLEQVGGSSHDNKRMSDPSRSCGPFPLSRERLRYFSVPSFYPIKETRLNKNKCKKNRKIKIKSRSKMVLMPIGSDANLLHLIRQFLLLFYRGGLARPPTAVNRLEILFSFFF